MEQVADNKKLNEALSHVEDLQQELSTEKDERAKREASLEETVRELQERSLAEEKKSECT